ncbi:hypothetical protein QAD02_000279 [Eretmocerus hayati]|uniref:Uncharacterized protein n=1 Tax=Eretmocerus hayati TaxID=131215 RepID=A0ACC2NCX4_9HYME|nr:hypothetical protein QAD02_000279 [Eretmocerus hayati]
MNTSNSERSKMIRFPVLAAEPVRILLMRECEWRGRKLLFDSVADQRNKQSNHEDVSENNNVTTTCRNTQKNETKMKDRFDESISEDRVTAVACEHEKLLDEDISLLSEMIFGSVAMTYRGPSFKIHSMDKPRCIMCTKVFPHSEHSVCRRSERYSGENLKKSGTFDSNPSVSSLQNHSRSGSGNLSSNSLSPTMRKNSTCSSTGSGWDIDVPRLCSSQSLDGVTSATGSLSSLRQRWHRAMSTSLSRNSSDEAFGRCFDGSMSPDEPIPPRTRHKTRLGLAILLQLPEDNAEQLSRRLMEHVALLEGALEQLRHACRGPTHEKSLISRLHKTSRCCSMRLLTTLAAYSTRSFSESPAPLLWHEQLLHGTFGPLEVRVDEVHRSVKRMCWLLQQLDTKSTNLFLSTIVTAVLTNHLGWVNSALPCANRQLLESLKQQYPCNPLWAQLTDLLGALGTPVRVAHTVVAGKSSKASLIESVLNFLSYFVRSGLVERRSESRCADQEDVNEAIVILERTLRTRKSLTPFTTSTTGALAISSNRLLRTSGQQLEIAGPSETPKFQLGDQAVPDELLEPEKNENFGKQLKRSPTSHKNLAGFSGVSGGMLVLKSYESGGPSDGGSALSSSKVKIVVGKVDELDTKVPRPVVSLKDTMMRDFEESKMNQYELDSKLHDLRQHHKLTGIANFDPDPKSLSVHSVLVQSSNALESSNEAKNSQVYFTLGPEQDKPTSSIRDRLRSQCKCECSFTFTRMPSSSAELPEGILRKIIQRNFPESSKNLRLSEDCEKPCLRCTKRSSFIPPQNNSKLLLETPSNATEVLRSCANGAETSRVRSTSSLEALMEANCIVELPMPRSKKPAPGQQRSRHRGERTGFTHSLIGSQTSSDDGFTWGMILQGFTKLQSQKRHEMCEEGSSKEAEWWQPIRESLTVEAKFPLVDQPVDEAVCVLGDLDTWRVSLLSSNDTRNSSPVPVGMSSLVSNMLEAFVCLWTQFHSPEQCIKLLESRLREMWLRSETLTEFLLVTDLSETNVENLTSYLDVDAADLPLLLAVATTHTPQIAQRFGISLA